MSCHSAVSPRASALAVWRFRCRNESLCECTTSLRFSVHFQSRILRFCKFATSLRYSIVEDFHVLPFHTLNPFCSVLAWSISLSKIFRFGESATSPRFPCERVCVWFPFRFSRWGGGISDQVGSRGLAGIAPATSRFLCDAATSLPSVRIGAPWRRSHIAA